MHGCDTVHEFVLSHEFVLYWRIHYPYSIYIFIRTWIRQNSMPETDEETMTTNDHSGIPDTLVVSSKNCLADLLIRSDNIKVFFPQTVYTSYNYCCTCVVGG